MKPPKSRRMLVYRHRGGGRRLSSPMGEGRRFRTREAGAASPGAPGETEKARVALKDSHAAGAPGREAGPDNGRAHGQQPRHEAGPGNGRADGQPLGHGTGPENGRVDPQQPPGQEAGEGHGGPHGQEGSGGKGLDPSAAGAQEEEPSSSGDKGSVTLSTDLGSNRDFIARELGFDVSFDVIIRDLSLSYRPAILVAVDGIIKDDVLLRITQFLNGQADEVIRSNSGDHLTFERFLRRGISYIETDTADDMADIIDAILAGHAAIIAEGFSKAVLLDVRSFPSRSVDEPDLERVVRGPRDGFTETLVFNTALIRRRLKDPRLRVESFHVGTRSKTQVAFLYIQDIANEQIVADVRRRVQQIETDGIPMAERSLEEFVVRHHSRWNPFPLVRFTERPDVTAIHLLEGHVALITDTSPAVMLMPVTFFHHLQHAQEFHEEPVTGLYVRWIRFVGVFFSWFGPALWLAAALAPEILPPGLRFIGPKEQASPIPLYLQLIIAESGIDLIRLALIHTPSALASSLGIIGAVLLGELAVEVGLFVPEVILYVALATVGNFATPSVEMGNAIRLQRLILILLAGLAGVTGFVAGTLAVLFLLATTKSFGVPYLWPLLPFNFRALRAVIMRQPIPSKQLRPSFLGPRDRDRN